MRTPTSLCMSGAWASFFHDLLKRLLKCTVGLMAVQHHYHLFQACWLLDMLDDGT